MTNESVYSASCRGYLLKLISFLFLTRVEKLMNHPVAYIENEDRKKKSAKKSGKGVKKITHLTVCL